MPINFARQIVSNTGSKRSYIALYMHMAHKQSITRRINYTYKNIKKTKQKHASSVPCMYRCFNTVAEGIRDSVLEPMTHKGVYMEG